MHVKVNGVEYCSKEEKEKPFITLELSKEAAHALMYVVGAVDGGSKSGRMYTDAVYDALESSGLDTFHNHFDVVDGTIEFKD